MPVTCRTPTAAGASGLKMVPFGAVIVMFSNMP